MIRRLTPRAALGFACPGLVPAVASAQGSVTGVGRDTSGAVLPGVTVEAARRSWTSTARCGSA